MLWARAGSGRLARPPLLTLWAGRVSPHFGPVGKCPTRVLESWARDFMLEEPHRKLPRP